jgi:hypothetical protein
LYFRKEENLKRNKQKKKADTNQRRLDQEQGNARSEKKIGPNKRSLD